MKPRPRRAPALRHPPREPVPSPESPCTRRYGRALARGAPRLGTEVFVKLISAQLSEHPAAEGRFAREAAARVNSPHVVKILDYGTSAEGTPFIVMEKLEGQDLSAHLTERGSLPPDSVARIIRQLAKALTKAHAARIVHRDIKPANVFVCNTEGELFVKLLDFGVAKTLATEAQGATVSGMCVGTAGYMSPEQIVASKLLDFRADLWSLGVLAFHCLTGRKPFEGDTPGGYCLRSGLSPCRSSRGTFRRSHWPLTHGSRARAPGRRTSDSGRRRRWRTRF